jgi:tripartite-type tricarboxylate transporter receptor subunit TctC
MAAKLYAAVQATLKAPEVQAQFEREGASTVVMDSAAFAEYIKAEMVKWTRVVKEGKIKAH